jgi:hypothetical protein
VSPRASLALLACLLAGCVAARRAPGPTTDLAPTSRPVERSDEAGLWMQADRIEGDLKSSALLVRDPGLEEYVRTIACRLAGPHCSGLRVYVVRRPAFYASMAPNGMMQVSTGLLLRVANEAQLAYVLGHEIAHYVRRHALQRWEDFHAKAANLGPELGGIAAFSREHELEADQLGFELMVRDGYDPREAARVWERLMEAPVRARTTSDVFLATHPPTTERLARLRDSASRATAPSETPRTGRDDYLVRVRPLRGWMLRDEVRRREFSSTEALIRHLIADGDGLGELHFHLGEINRLRERPGDLPVAVGAYRRALEHPDAPAEVLRSLAFVHLRLGDRAAARDAFARYLARQPDADDRELIARQVADLEAGR